MFSFHRPKVYRSSTGCCICKAKSSSSRFTDSKKYEDDFLECFKLSTPRQGEICNACVLLVKRWKKLPVGSDRNWQHVVDARAGPGMKSFTKFKTKNKKQHEEKHIEKIKRKKHHFEREYSPGLSDKSDPADDEEMDFLEDGPSIEVTRNASLGDSDNEDVPLKKRTHGRRRKTKPQRRQSPFRDIVPFIDPVYWKKELTCCGPIYRGLDNEVIIETGKFKPCPARLAEICKLRALAVQSKTASAILGDPATPKTYSDNSSDSGYDESSNQMAMSPDNPVPQGNLVIDQENSVKPAVSPQGTKVIVLANQEHVPSSLIGCYGEQMAARKN